MVDEPREYPTPYLGVGGYGGRVGPPPIVPGAPQGTQIPEGTALPEGLSPEEGAAVREALAMTDQSYRAMARRGFYDAGVTDLSNGMVQAYLDGIEANSEHFDANPGSFEIFMQQAVTGLTEVGVLTQTPYSASLAESGFGFQDPTFTPPMWDYSPAGIQTLANFEGEGVDFVTNQQTGWVQWKDGTLVNPNYEIGALGAVIFEPNSLAPGSTRWLRETVPSWNAGKINEWRQKLVDGGYLSGDMSKGPVDATFLNAMQQYQTVRYQNGGSPMAIGPVLGGATGTTPFNFRQLQGQVRNDIRTQWMAVYGVDPTDDDIQPLEDMVIKTAHRLYKKGQMSASQAAVEAEERMIARLQSSPEAQFVTSNVEENTQLRDSILRAVQVTSAMG